MASLDPVARDRLTELVHELKDREGTTLVWATSRLEEVRSFDHYLHLDPAGARCYSAGWNPVQTRCLKPAAARLAQQIGRDDICWDWPADLELPPLREPTERSDSPGLEVRELCYCLEDDSSLFQQLSFRLGVGETVGLIGPNGAGKSTLGKLLRGLLRSRSGQILVEDQDLGALGAAAPRCA